jgi:hypothetical protein
MSTARTFSVGVSGSEKDSDPALRGCPRPGGLGYPGLARYRDVDCACGVVKGKNEAIAAADSDAELVCTDPAMVRCGGSSRQCTFCTVARPGTQGP